MLKFLLCLVLFACISFVTCLGLNSRILGPGQWMVLNILQCEDPDQYDIAFSVSRKKLNRTHDCFYLSSDLHREINSTHSIIIDVFKEVDGGFKFYHVYTDTSACDLLMKFAEENTKRALAMGGFDPPDCPMRPRFFEIKDFVMDYTELPKNGVYGKFKANVYLIYDNVKVGCVQVLINFEEQEHEEYDDD